MDNNSLPAFKLNLEDLQTCKRVGELWSIQDYKNNSCRKFELCHVQGKIVKTSGINNMILILEDTTGKAKITKGDTIPGDLSWIKPGVTCSIIGKLQESGKLPHILATKIAQVTSPILLMMWPLEVAEVKLFLDHDITPKLSCNK